MQGEREIQAEESESSRERDGQREREHIDTVVFQTAAAAAVKIGAKQNNDGLKD